MQQGFLARNRKMETPQLLSTILGPKINLGTTVLVHNSDWKMKTSVSSLVIARRIGMTGTTFSVTSKDLLQMMQHICHDLSMIADTVDFFEFAYTPLVTESKGMAVVSIVFDVQTYPKSWSTSHRSARDSPMPPRCLGVYESRGRRLNGRAVIMGPTFFGDFFLF